MPPWENGGPRKKQVMEDRGGDKDPERSIYIPQPAPEEGMHVREGKRVTNPMLPVSVTLFPLTQDCH